MVIQLLLSSARHAARTPPLASSSCAMARGRLVALTGGLLRLGTPGPSKEELALPDWQGALMLPSRNLLQPSAAQKRPEEACRLEGDIRGAEGGWEGPW